jgi:hypothetical protein
MKLKLKTLVASSVLLWTGCAMGPPTQQEIAAAVAVTGYGAPLTIDWQAAIKQWFFTT